MRGWYLRRRPDEHLTEADLALWALAGPDAVEPVVAAHLSACGTCATELGRVSESLDEYWRLEAANGDRAFTAERLQRQRLSVLRRLGAPHECAKILRFPAAARFIAPPRRHVVRRSVAAAAIGGLLIGAIAGRMFDFRARQATLPSAQLTRTTPAPAVPARVQMVATSADEAFLRDFDAALGTPRVQPLRALDALTPAGDVGSSR